MGLRAFPTVQFKAEIVWDGYSGGTRGSSELVLFAHVVPCMFLSFLREKKSFL